MPHHHANEKSNLLGAAMSRSFLPRPVSRLSNPIQLRLNAYALAASAVGIGMLALPPVSEAKIVCTPVRHSIDLGMHYKLDLNHDGITDFTLQNIPCTMSCRGEDLSVIPAGGNGVSGFRSFSRGPGSASALMRGAEIGTRRYFPGRFMAWVGTTGDGGSVSGGSWLNVKNRYLGFKFKIAGKIHYGWARLSVQVHNYPGTITAILTGYAYETIPNKPIVAGKTRGKDVTTEQSGSLGHLARGAVAVSK
jgi:hypothetical protein